MSEVKFEVLKEWEELKKKAERIFKNLPPISENIGFKTLPTEAHEPPVVKDGATYLNKIIKTTTIVNGQPCTEYLYKDIGYINLAQALKACYVDQGNFYKELGISRRQANIAGWHPNAAAFDASKDTGWAKFLEDKGTVEEEITTSNITINDVISGKEK